MDESNPPGIHLHGRHRCLDYNMLVSPAPCIHSDDQINQRIELVATQYSTSLDFFLWPFPRQKMERCSNAHHRHLKLGLHLFSLAGPHSCHPPIHPRQHSKTIPVRLPKDRTQGQRARSQVGKAEIITLAIPISLGSICPLILSPCCDLRKEGGKKIDTEMKERERDTHTSLKIQIFPLALNGQRPHTSASADHSYHTPCCAGMARSRRPDAARL